MVCANVDKILTIMCDSCMTATEIAAAANVSKTAVYRIRQGYMVKMEIMGRVCKVLGVKCEEVLDYEKIERYRKEMRRQ